MVVTLARVVVDVVMVVADGVLDGQLFLNDRIIG